MGLVNCPLPGQVQSGSPFAAEYPAQAAGT